MNITECRKGSTFSNLLLVIVVLVVLAAVLMPALNRGREYTPKSPCANNIKELAVALQLYYNDYDSTLPSSALVSHSKQWSKADFLRFATKIGKTPSASSKRTTYSEILYDYMKTKDIMLCYEDSSDHTAPGAHASYWWKLAIDKAWYGEGCKPCRKEADFVYSSDQIIFYEHREFHQRGQRGLANGVQINVAFLDTHVKTATLKNATTGDPVNCAANSDGEPMWFNYNFDADKGLPNAGTPAEFVDPRVCGDAL